jgi:hypothetical protein
VFTVRERENVMDQCCASYDSRRPRCVRFWARLDTDTTCVVHGKARGSAKAASMRECIFFMELCGHPTYMPL